MPATPPALLPASPRASPAAPAVLLLVPPSAGSPSDSAVRRDRTEKIALFRYQLIRAAADAAVTTRQRGPMVRDLAAIVHPGPFGGTVTVSKDTIDRWIRDWRRGGFDAMKPRGRAPGAAARFQRVEPTTPPVPNPPVDGVFRDRHRAAERPRMHYRREVPHHRAALTRSDRGIGRRADQLI